MLYKIYTLDREKGWLSYARVYSYEEVMLTIDSINGNKYSRAFVVAHDFNMNCDIPMFGVSLDKSMVLKKTVGK